MSKIRLTLKLDNGLEFSDIVPWATNTKDVVDKVLQTSNNLIITNETDDTIIFNWSHIVWVSVKEVSE